jgi:hypothetical protein
VRIDSRFFDRSCPGSLDGQHYESLGLFIVNGGAKQLSVCCEVCQTRAHAAPQGDLSALADFGYDSLDGVPVINLAHAACEGNGCSGCQDHACTAPGCTTPYYKIHWHHVVHVHMVGKQLADTYGRVPYCEHHHALLHNEFNRHHKRELIAAVERCLDEVGVFLQLDVETQTDLRKHVRKQSGNPL